MKQFFRRLWCFHVWAEWLPDEGLSWKDPVMLEMGYVKYTCIHCKKQIYRRTPPIPFVG